MAVFLEDGDDMVKLPFVRSAFNYDRNVASDESGLKCEDESLTKQSFAEEADINFIVRRFNLTGELPTDIRAPQHGDFIGVDNYHAAMNLVAAAGEAFDRLPAAVRSRFLNNPLELVEFCSDEKNREEAEKLGLVFKKPAVPVVEPPKAAPAAPAPSTT